MIPTWRQKVMFCSMRKRQVANVVTQSRKSNYPSPVAQLMISRHLRSN